MEYKFAPLEAEVEADGTVTGYGSKFGVKDQGGDIVVMGAFAKSLSVRQPKMLAHHDPARPIGVWTEAKEDGEGLRLKGQINLDVKDGAETYSLVKQGAIDGLSIGYRTRDAQKTKAGRELKQLDLHEVSFVTFPMLPVARVESVKGLVDETEIKRFVEKLLREADFSPDEAKAAAAAVARVKGEREAPTDASVRLELLNALRGL